MSAAAAGASASNNGRISERGFEFWRPEPWFAGATVFLLGGGPSLRGFDFERLRGREVVAINQAALFAPWALLFFTDNSWFDQNRALVEGWAGEVVTVSRAAKATLPDKIRRVEIEERPDFPPLGSGTIRGARSSGHSALSLSIALGAARVVLLGYDLRFVDGRSHFHDAYAAEHDRLYDTQFMAAWTGWGAAASAAGVEVLNATPGSALREFPMVELEDLLR